MHGGRNKHYALLWLVEGVGGTRLGTIDAAGPHLHRRVNPKWWTRHSISNIMRSLSCIILMCISNISMRIIRRSLMLSKSNLILSSLSSRRVGVMLRGAEGWSTRPDRTAMDGGLLCSHFYLTSVDMWHAGYGSMPM